MKYLNPYKVFESQSQSHFSISDEDINKLLDDQQGFNTREDAKEYLDSMIKHYKSMGNTINLYRVIFVEDKGDIDSDNLGEHWTHKEVIDTDWLRKIKETNDTPDYFKTYVIEGHFKMSDINWDYTLHTNMQFPNEEEITVKENPFNYKIYTLEEFNKI